MESITYGAKLTKKYAEENPDYFLCSKKDVCRLIEEAKIEANRILKELAVFFIEDIGIEIVPREHVLGWSIAANLIINKKVVKTEDPCDLLFLELNELMMKRMLESGMFDFEKKANKDKQN